jgi:hypothetical protein
MATPIGPPWIRGPVARRGYRYSTLHLRVSDAERAEVADRLSKHYADGRLDQAEFAERLDQAMAAKTQADLGGLFVDLPDPDGPTGGVARPPKGHPHSYRWLLILVVIIGIASVGHIVVSLYHPWLLIGLIAAVLLLRHDLLRRRR